MRCIILGFFQLVLGVFSKLFLYVIDKGLKFFKIILEESFEVIPCDWSGVFIAALVLSLSKADGATKECGGKRGTINPDCA